jgi:hypothetical protein
MNQRLELYLPCGRVILKGLGEFAEGLRKEILTPITNSYDDDVKVHVVETGSFQEESPLQFRNVVYKMSQIFDYGLFDKPIDAAHDVKSIQNMATVHFAANSLKRLIEKTPVSISTQEPDLQTIEDAGILFLREHGADPSLIFVNPNITILASEADFRLMLADVYNPARRMKCLYGVVICTQPTKVIKIQHEKPLRLSGLK